MVLLSSLFEEKNRIFFFGLISMNEMFFMLFFFYFIVYRLIKWVCPVSFVIMELVIPWQLHRQRIAEYHRIN